MVAPARCSIGAWARMASMQRSGGPPNSQSTQLGISVWANRLCTFTTAFTATAARKRVVWPIAHAVRKPP